MPCAQGLQRIFPQLACSAAYCWACFVGCVITDAWYGWQLAQNKKNAPRFHILEFPIHTGATATSENTQIRPADKCHWLARAIHRQGSCTVYSKLSSDDFMLLWRPGFWSMSSLKVLEHLGVRRLAATSSMLLGCKSGREELHSWLPPATIPTVNHEPTP